MFVLSDARLRLLTENPGILDVHRDSFFDAYKCREKCAELAKQKLNIDKRICGICVSVCPIGKKSFSNNKSCRWVK